MSIRGDRVKDLRFKRGIEATELAYKAGISEAYVYRIESKTPPNVGADILNKLVGALDTTADYLLGRTDDPNPANYTPPEEEFDPDVHEVLDLTFAMMRDIRHSTGGRAALRRLVNVYYMQAQAYSAAMRYARGESAEEEPDEREPDERESEAN